MAANRNIAGSSRARGAKHLPSNCLCWSVNWLAAATAAKWRGLALSRESAASPPITERYARHNGRPIRLQPPALS